MGSQGQPYNQEVLEMGNLQPTTDTAPSHGAQPASHPINIIVEVNGKNKHVQFDKPLVTGREIRNEAGAPLTDDLTRLEHGKPTGGNIGLDDVVEIHNGDHFIALLTGTVS